MGTEKRVRVVGNHGPVKGQGEQPHAGNHAKDLVDGQVVGRDPADPGKIAEAGPDQTGEPVPDEGGGAHDHEELDAGDAPAVGDGVGARVQRRQQRHVAQDARPNHAGGLDEPGDGQARDGVAAELAAQDHEHGESWRDGEAVEARGLDDVGRVGGAKAKRDVGHDGHEGVLLDVEVPVRVEAADGQRIGEADAEGEGEELGDQGHDADSGVAEGEELVYSGAKENKDLNQLLLGSGENVARILGNMVKTYNAKKPSPEGVDRNRRVVRLRDHGPHLRERRCVGLIVALVLDLGQDPAHVHLELGEVSVLEFDILAVEVVRRLEPRRLFVRGIRGFLLHVAKLRRRVADIDCHCSSHWAPLKGNARTQLRWRMYKTSN